MLQADPKEKSYLTWTCSILKMVRVVGFEPTETSTAQV